MREFLPVVLALVLAGASWYWWRRFRPRVLCTLALREGAGLGLEFPVTARVATIGSEEEHTVVISDPKVSRRHAVLSLEGGDFVLRDCSQHGTRVNGAPVQEVVLHSGDLIRLGESVDVIFTRPA